MVNLHIQVHRRDQSRADQNLNLITFDQRREKFFIYRCLDEFRKNNTKENKQSVVRARAKYKNTVKRFNFEIDRQKRMKLIHAQFKNAKQYKNLLKESVSQPKPKRLSANDLITTQSQLTILKIHFFNLMMMIYYISMNDS